METNNANHQLSEGIKTLKTCQPLVARLLQEGLTITLDQQEQAKLRDFKKLVDADFTDSQWSYLRIASATQMSGIAVLKTCLIRFLASQKTEQA